MNALTLVLAAAEGKPDPVGHVIAHPFFTIDGWWVWSSAIGNMFLAGVIMLLVGPYVARRVATGPERDGDERYLTKNRFVELIETMCIGIRDGVLQPLLGHRTAKFAPFLLALFFFILLNNLLGLIPIADALMMIVPAWRAEHIVPFGGTATQSLWVTGGLALVAFLVINASGVREMGVVEYLKHLTAGTPWPLWPIMIPVELLGILIKPAALALRLFANMTAGHILMAVLFLFIEMGYGLMASAQNTLLGAAGFGFIGILAGAAAIGIYLLEVFIAFLQAFIFMFLTAVFIALYEDHSAHDHHDAHDTAGAHGAIEPALQPVAA